MKRILLIQLILIVLHGTLNAQNELPLLHEYLTEHPEEGVSQRDLAEMRVSSSYLSPTTGWFHIYTEQVYEEIPVYNRLLNCVLVNGEVKHMVNQFEDNIESKVTVSDKFSTDVQSAVLNAVKSVGIQKDKLSISDNQVSVLSASGKPLSYVMTVPEISAEPVRARLYWYPVKQVDTDQPVRFTVAWNIEFAPDNSENIWSVFVNATTGEIEDTFDDVIHCQFDGPVFIAKKTQQTSVSQIAVVAADSSYRVFPYPLESPNHGSHTLVTKPYTDFVDSGTGPGITNGWHNDGTTSYNYTRGNNVYAYHDVFDNNFPVANSSPVSVNLGFDYGYSAFGTHAGNRDAAITNLFYWNNAIHDILWKYGFDEPSGNFQADNMSRGGIGGDHVLAEAQDGGGINNANFSTPTDGFNGRMQMYVFDINGDTDGDFDNGVITHEYGHGWSIRLTGGPGNSSCLRNDEQGGEGWSDYIGLMLTTDWANLSPNLTDAGISRGVGSYVLGQPVTGDGIRPYPYSYDMVNVNSNVTYAAVADLDNFSQPHGIGSVWATMLWDMTWEIILEDNEIVDDIHNVPASISAMRGNIAALKLVNEGLRLQPCSPGFIEARDAILKADEMLFGGRYHCAIGRAFARRGLGALAHSNGSSNDRSVTEDFTPLSGSPLSSLLVNPAICSGETFNYTATVSGSGPFTFSWIRLATGGISGSSGGSSATISEALTNTANSPVQVTYKITASPDACNTIPAPQLTFVTVKPKVQPLIGTYNVCQGTSVPTGEGLVAPAALSNTVSGTLNTGTTTYTRSFGSDITFYQASSTGSNVRYRTYQFVAAVSQPLIIQVSGGTMSGGYPRLMYLSLYDGTFSPANPGANFLKGDDVSGDFYPSPKLKYDLVAGNTYVIVASAYFSSSTGGFSLESNIPVFSGTNQWFTGLAGGSAIATGNIFNPLGVSGSGIANTTNPISKTYYASTTSYPECRTPVSFHVNSNTASAGLVAASQEVCPGINSGTLSASGFLGTVQRWESSTNNFSTITPISNTTSTLNFNNLSSDTEFRTVVKNGACMEKNSLPALVVMKKNIVSLSSPANNINGMTKVLEAIHNLEATIAITNSSNVLFRAEKSIELKPGFEVSSSVFEALLEEVCN